MYFTNEEIRDLDAVSLVQKQQELVALGKKACRNGHNDLALDVFYASTLHRAFTSDYSQLSEFVGHVDWGAVWKTLDCLNRLDTEVVFALWGKRKTAFHVKGTLSSSEDEAFDPTRINALRQRGLSLGIIAGVPYPEPENWSSLEAAKGKTWGAADEHIAHQTFVAFECDPFDRDLRSPEAQRRVIEEKLPELAERVSVMTWSGNKSLSCYLTLDEPVSAEEAEHLTRRVAQFVQERAPELCPDFKICNSGRIWRLPGEAHHATDERSYSVFLEKRTVAVSDLDALLPEVPLKKALSRECEVTEEEVKYVAKLVARWPEGLAFPSRQALGPKRSLRGVKEGGRQQAGWSLSDALRAAALQLQALGVPFVDDHDEVLEEFCASCVPPHDPAQARSTAVPGEPDLGIVFVIRELAVFTAKHCGFSNTQREKALQEVNELQAKREVETGVRSAGLVTPEVIAEFENRLLDAHLAPGDSHNAVQAIRAQMASWRIDVQAVESHIIHQLGLRWGVNFDDSHSYKDGKHTRKTYKGGTKPKDSSKGQFLLDGILIKGETNLIFGEEGTGKTLHAMQIIRSLLYGTPFLYAQAPQPLAADQKVLYIATDMCNQADSAFARYEQILGYDKDPKWQEQVVVVRADEEDKVASWSLKPKDLVWLEEELRTNNYALVVIDSLSSVCQEAQIAGLSEYDVGFVPVYKTMNNLICKYSTLLWLHHTRKDNKVAGVPMVTRIPSTVHTLTVERSRGGNKGENSVGVKRYFWEARKTRHGRECKVEVFQGEDHHFFVTGRDKSLDLTSAVIAILSTTDSGFSRSDLLARLQNQQDALLGDRRVTPVEAEVIVDLKMRENGTEDGRSQFLRDIRMPNVTRTTLGRVLNQLKNDGYVEVGDPVKTTTRPAETVRLSPAGRAKAEEIKRGLNSLITLDPSDPVVPEDDAAPAAPKAVMPERGETLPEDPNEEMWKA